MVFQLVSFNFGKTLFLITPLGFKCHYFLLGGFKKFLTENQTFLMQLLRSLKGYPDL